MTNTVCMLIVIGFYPALVLLIAITGPHNETEKRELRALRARTQETTDVE